MHGVYHVRVHCAECFGAVPSKVQLLAVTFTDSLGNLVESYPQITFFFGSGTCSFTYEYILYEYTAAQI